MRQLSNARTSLLAQFLLAVVAGVAGANGEVIAHHDGSFETGLGWAYALRPPDLGSFAEEFEAAGEVSRIAFYLTAVNGNSIAEPDIYLWESASSNPGAVIAVVEDAFFTGVGFWPMVTRHEAAISGVVDGPFFAGLWPMYVDDVYFVGADTDGPPNGTSRTKVPDNQEWPVGWYDVNQVWDMSVHSLGIEVTVEQEPTPVRNSSWAAIKAMYR